jgi:hypothetical protein
VADGDDLTVLDHLAVILIRPIEESFSSRVNGSLDMGLSYTDANALAQFTFNMDATIARPKYSAGYDLSSTFVRQRDAEDTSRHVFSLSYQRFLQSRWLALVTGRLDHNREMGFDLRGTFLVGGGRYLVQTNRNLLVAAVGLALNLENPTGPRSSTRNGEAAIAVRYATFAYDFPSTDIEISCLMFPSLTIDDRIRVEVNARLRREVVKDFYVSLNVFESYDSKPPSDAADENDFGASLTLGWSF